MTGLVGWWPLHETTGSTATDLSGNQNHGSVNGVTQGVAGKAGLTAYNFDGVDDYVQVQNNSFWDTSSMTISVWIKVSADADGRFIDFGSGQRTLAIGDFVSSGNIGFRTQIGGVNEDLDSGYSPVDGEWVHVAGTYDSETGEKHIYINGESRNSDVLDGSLDSPGGGKQYLALASDAGGGSQFVDCTMSDSRAYDRALSPEEVNKLYRQGTSDFASYNLSDGSDSGAVSRFKLNDGGDDGSSAVDSWGSNGGNISGSGWSFTDNSVRNPSYSLNFTGGDYISTSFNPAWSSNQSFTISAWVKLDNTGDRYYIVSKNNGSGDGFILSSYNGDFIWNVGNGSSYTKIRASNNLSWNHVVGVRDNTNGEAKFYLNGGHVGSKSINDYSTDGSELVLGAYNADNSTYSYEGNLDDLRIFSKALRPWEVFELYRWGTKGIDMRKKLVNARGNL